MQKEKILEYIIKIFTEEKESVVVENTKDKINIYVPTRQQYFEMVEPFEKIEGVNVICGKRNNGKYWKR